MTPDRRAVLEGSSADWERAPRPALPESLVHVLREHADHRPDDRASTFLDSDGTEAGSYTYGDLDRRARAIAADLMARGATGQRALLLYPPGIDFVAGFFGCLYAGAIPVPLPAPRPVRSGRGNERIVSAARDAQPRFALNSSQALEKSRERLGESLEIQSLEWIATDLVEDSRAAAWRPPSVRQDSLAVLQYTSGSTSAPRGVMVTHRNVLHNSRMLSTLTGLPSDGTVVSWLPTFHDMGLVGCVLFPIFAGGHTVLLSPAAFLRRPLSWLEAVSRYRAYQSGGPDFGFALCTRAAKEGREVDLDLSSWKVAFTGSEPIRANTMKRFARSFERSGFRPGAFLPCYGLAEATLMVTGCSHRDDPTFLSVDPRALVEGRLVASAGRIDGHTLVGCGRTIDATVRIVDPTTAAVLEDGRVGEIWVRSESVASGYWQRPQESEPIFRATTRDGDGPYLRTGDLGAFHRGELFVTGRAKDMIILRGQNYYPHDIEESAELSHERVRASSVAAFSIEADGEERLVVALEIDPGGRNTEPEIDLPSLAAAVRESVTREHQIPVYAVAALKAGGIPRTSSGKIRRGSCRDAFLAGQLPVIGTSFLPSTDPEDEGLTRPSLFESNGSDRRRRLLEFLAQSLARILRIPSPVLRPREALVHFGADSLALIQWIAGIESRFETSISLEALAAGMTLEDLADAILSGEEVPQDPRFEPLEPAPEARYEAFGLTDIQQAYVAGRTAAYGLGGVGCHVYFEFRVDGLDVDGLERAWQELVSRHDMLRAVVTPDGRQRVLADTPPYRFAREDWSRQSPEAAEESLRKIREDLSDRVFEPGEWPLFDVRVTKLPSGTRLHFAIDLLIADATSVVRLFSEWARLYRGDSPLPPLEATFRDYIIAQRQLRRHPRYRRSIEHWRGRLDVLAPAPELPLIKDPAEITRPRFRRRTRTIDSSAWSRLKSRASRLGFTPAGLLLAVYAEVLARWSKRPQFTINVTISQRLPLHPEIAQVVGDFTSIMLVPYDRSAGVDFASRARALGEELWRSLDHRFVSGIEVIRELAHRQQGAQTAMPVVFTSVLEADPESIAECSQWLGAPVFGVSRTPHVWLDHSVSEGPNGLTLNWDAAEELFPDGLLDDFVSASADLLSRLAEDERAWDAPSIELLPEPQLARRGLANATAVPLPSVTLASSFVDAAAQKPQQPALVAGRRRMSYAELDRRSSAAAASLVQWGLPANSLAAIVMESGWEQVVAALAVARSGAAYVPIDASLPTDRILAILEHSQAPVALTQPRVAARIPWPSSLPRLLIDDAEQGAGAPNGRWAPPAGGGDLAYVIYTSGSTGRPKGVAIDHRGAANTIVDINARFGVSPSDKILALSSLSFDLSVYDIFGALAAGATIVHPEGETRDPEVWARLIEDEQVTIWNSVPALMEMLVDSVAARRRDLSSLRLILLSGDWIPVALPDRIRALVPEARIVSLGGATEASIWSIYHPITKIDPEWKSIPYGRPLSNQSFYVLNASLDNAPDWVPGTLFIGGAGLARGYWNDEETTRRRFVRHPRTHERLYDTGDLGRYLPDGNIEFLGREDFQVKIQGFRVELSEVESVLSQHADVRAAAVVAVGEKRGHKRLVAYVVPQAAGPAASIARSEGNGNRPAGDVLLVDSESRRRFREDRRALRADLDGAVCVPLGEPGDPADREHFRKRRSARRFRSEPIALETLSALLAPVRQIDLDGGPKRRYASAGGLYPVQIYVHAKPRAVEALDEGLYYYDPSTHHLRLLAAGASIPREIHVPYNRSIFDSATLSVFLIGDLDAISPVYGGLAKDFCLLEAGSMSQLLMQSAGEQSIGLCPIGVVAFETIAHLFTPGDHRHCFLHALVGGPIADGDAQLAEPLLPPPGADAPAPHPPASFADSLRRFAESKLPRQMVPATFVVLDALPLTRNGKIDRSALQNGPLASREPAAAAPTSLESEILQIVKDVLQTDVVEPDRNLFDVGANSIHLVQMHGRVQELIGRQFSVVDLFQHPSVSALARHLCREAGEAAQQSSRAGNRRDALARRAAARSRARQTGEPTDG